MERGKRDSKGELKREGGKKKEHEGESADRRRRDLRRAEADDEEASCFHARIVTDSLWVYRVRKRERKPKQEICNSTPQNGCKTLFFGFSLLIGSICTYSGTYKCAWSRVMAKVTPEGGDFLPSKVGRVEDAK